MAVLLIAAVLALGASAEEFIGPETRDALSGLEARAREAGRSPPPHAAECRALGTAGCWLPAPGGAGADPALLVYFRGYWRGHGDGRVPERERLASSRQALEFYGLEAAAAQAGAAVLVTGSSDAAVTEKEIAAVEQALGVPFGRLLVAAHSGGYAGLLRSLPGLRRPDRIVMLDDFYFTDAAQVALLEDRVRAGAVCTGFLTAHNEARWRQAFRGRLDCAVERRDDLGHQRGVNACLGAYLTGTACGGRP